MKKVLILCLHRPGRSPSQRYRFEQYLSYLSQHGYSFDFSYLLNEKDDKAFYRPRHFFSKLRIVLKSIIKRYKEIKKAKNYNLVFVQREAFMLGTSYFEKKIAGRVPMIFDFDDSIWLHRVSKANKWLSFLKRSSKTSHLISYAKLVIAGNNYLAAYALQYNPRVSIIPSTIDMEVYKVDDKKIKPGNKICIGWSGSFSTIPYFEMALPALKKIKEKYKENVYFKIIGDENYYCKELDTAAQAWNATTEVADLSELDIGIMPLPDDEWSKGKCGMKGLQYMGLGIATVMSPVGVNTTIIQHSVNGFLASDEESWVYCLSELIDNEDLRKKIGDSGRQTVSENYSFQVWKNKYLEYFDQAIENK